MGSINVSKARTFPFINQAVYRVNGSIQTPDYDLVCMGGVTNHGHMGTTATFRIPRARWDDDREHYENCRLIVYSSEGTSQQLNPRPIFRGWIQADSANLTPDEQDVEFSAVSVVPMLSKVMVGQAGNYRYPSQAALRTL